MNKPKLKCLIALLCSSLGIVLFLLALCIPIFSSTTHTLLLALGSILVILGGIAFYIDYQNVKLISKLKKQQLPVLAQWSYSPLQVDSIRTALLEEKHSMLSIMILSALLVLLLDLGFILTSTRAYLSFSIITATLVILFCTIVCLAIQFYYHHKLTHPVNAIVSENFIYFCGELYGLSRSLYLLEEVQVLEGSEIYLQFIYGSPGTPYDPIYILTLPIPTEDLDLAFLVKDHFSSLLDQ